MFIVWWIKLCNADARRVQHIAKWVKLTAIPGFEGNWSSCNSDLPWPLPHSGYHLQRDQKSTSNYNPIVRLFNCDQKKKRSKIQIPLINQSHRSNRQWLRRSMNTTSGTIWTRHTKHRHRVVSRSAKSNTNQRMNNKKKKSSLKIQTSKMTKTNRTIAVR